MRKNKRRPFTLLELFIVLSILACISTAVIWNLKGLMNHHRFQQNVDDLIAELKKGQFLAMTYSADLEFVIKKEKKDGHFYFHLSSGEPIKYLKAASKKIDAITSIAFDQKKLDQCKLQIFSNGRIEPLGILSVSMGDEESRFETSIDFRFPLKIRKI